MEGPKAGAFVPLTRPDQLLNWAELMERKHKEMPDAQDIIDWEDEEEEEESTREEQTTTATWSWRKLLNAFLGEENKKKKLKKTSTSAVKAPDAFNIYERNPDFRNKYGWSVAVSHRDYTPLRLSDIGVYLVNLTAGSMMAPHLNPTAMEYGIVLQGSGSIQVVFPNGTSAMNANVKKGDVFWIPRYFPFCQIASRSEHMEFFGFTTSARHNRPQFLVGQSSILETMSGPEMAASFGTTEESFREFVGAQRESIILPARSVAPPSVQDEEVTEIRMRVGVI